MKEKTKLNPEKGHPSPWFRYRLSMTIECVNFSFKFLQELLLNCQKLQSMFHPISRLLDWNRSWFSFTKIMNIWLKTIVSVTLSKYKTDSGLQNRTFGLFVIFSHCATSLDIFFDLFWSETIENILNFDGKIIRVFDDFSSLKTSSIDRHFVQDNNRKKIIQISRKILG